MAPPVDWLGRFIEQELRAVVDWQRATQNKPKKPKTGDRFNSDGSNFYSVAETSHLPPNTDVQILEVLSHEQPATVLLSDGFTHVKAFLSRPAVAALEAEIEEKLSEDTNGDVVAIAKVIVVGTPLGPPTGFIHLKVDAIEYQHHLRRLHKSTKAIEDLETVRSIVNTDLTEILNRQYALNEGSAYVPFDLTSDDATAGAQASDEPIRKRRRPNEPPFQTPVRASQPSSARPLAPTQGASSIVATQISASKVKRPSLSSDGLEMESGVNLQGPQAANFQSPTSRPSRPKQQLVAVDPKTMHMLSLLKGSAKDPPPPPVSAARSPRLQSPVRQVTQPETGVLLASPPLVASQTEPDPAPEPASTVVNGHPASKDPVHSSPQNKSASSHQELTHNQQSSHRQHHRRPIPQDQRKLLEQESSWWPPLPGKKLPHPNVPIKLLERWNAEASAALKQQNLLNGHASHKVAPGNDNVEDQNDDSESTSSESSVVSDSEDEDEDVPLSGWDKSPTQRQAMLPPDSTMNSNSQASPVVDRRRIESPHNSSGMKLATPSPALASSYKLVPETTIVQRTTDRSPDGVPGSTGSQRPRSSSGWTAEDDRLILWGYQNEVPLQEMSTKHGLTRPPKLIQERIVELLKANPEAIRQVNMSPGSRSSRNNSAAASPSVARNSQPSQSTPTGQRLPSRAHGSATPDNGSFRKLPAAVPPSVARNIQPPQNTSTGHRLPSRPHGPATPDHGSSRKHSAVASPSVSASSRATNDSSTNHSLPPKPPLPQGLKIPGETASDYRAAEILARSGISVVATTAPKGRPSNVTQLDGTPETKIEAAVPPRQKQRVPKPSAHSSERAVMSPAQHRHTPVNAQQEATVKTTPSNTPIVILDDDIDVSVPRTLEQDPSMVHRQKRREHFAQARRQDWLKQNYVLSRQHPFNFSQVYNAYKKVRPDDAVRPSDFSEAIADVFPETSPNNAGFIGLAMRSNVGTTFPKHIATPVADPDAAQLFGRSSSQAGFSLDRTADHQEMSAVRLMREATSTSRTTKQPSVFAKYAQQPTNGGATSCASTPSSGRKLPWDERNGATMTDPERTSISSSRLRDQSTLRSPATDTGLDSGTELPPRALAKATPLQPPRQQHNKPRGEVPRDNTGGFGEFANAFKNLRPGGAFAEPQQKNGAKKQLNVLSWEL